MGYDMKQPQWAVLAFITLLVMVMLACTIPGTGPDTPDATPTPLGDTLPLSIPAFTYNLEPGGIVPGTRLEYVGPKDGAYEVRIDGQSALKRIGDSFIWSGVVSAGVYANYNLRLTTDILGPLPVAGSVELVIFNPQPIELISGEQIVATYYYNNIVVDYLVPQGRTIPGTTLTYVGTTTQGSGDQATELAQLSGTSGYPYLAVADSLVWTGQVRDNTVIRYDLRAASINENGLRLLGTAELWITE